MLWNALGIALREIRRNLVRGILTVLGVVIGVAAVIIMVSLGQGATESVTSQVESLGSNLVMAIPGQGMGPSGGAAPGFRLADATAIGEAVSGIEAVAPLRMVGVNAVYLQEDWSTQAVGTTVDYFSVAGWTFAEGRPFTEAEYLGARPACVLGATVVDELFGQQDPVGARIRLKTLTCEVVGALEAKGQGAMGQDQDSVIVLPLSTAQRRLAGRTSDRDVDRMMISVRDGVSPDRVVRDTTEVLRERRGIRAGEDDDFSVLDTKQIADALSSTTKILTLLLGAVAAVSLLVGGIGIMNIMLVSVTERTREIGIRMSIGALPREVLLQFLVEALVLSLAGGLVGFVLALGGSYALAQAMGVPFVFDPQINLVAFAFSAIVGVVFGFTPARRAAQLDPIEALRHE
ncbi:MAG: FtsX-like permease family protein [Acidimicrobiia bacterium]|jgi:putative ABC transport system permease protein|nr:FtsX-like permease family protein [Acidimicrobiia bacterium]